MIRAMGRAPYFLQLPSRGPRPRPWLSGPMVYGSPFDPGGEYMKPGVPIEAALQMARPAIAEEFPLRIAPRQRLPKPRYWLSGMGAAVDSELGPDTLPFDDGLPWTEQVGDNRGCFPGYFAQRVPPGSPDSSQPSSIGILAGGSVGVRCRRMDGFTANTNATESGQQAADSWLNFVNSVGQVGGSIGLNIGSGLQSLASWALVGAAVYLLILKEQGKR